MNKLEMLWVRACKSTDPKTRLASIARRFYLNDEPEGLLVSVLGELTTKYEIVTAQDAITYFLRPTLPYDEPESRTTRQMALDFLIDAVRYSPGNKFPGMIPPLIFRRPKTHSDHPIFTGVECHWYFRDGEWINECPECCPPKPTDCWGDLSDLIVPPDVPVFGAVGEQGSTS